MFRFVALALLASFALPASAQALWSDVSASRLPARTDVSDYRVVQLDLDALRAALEPSANGRRAATLPMPLPEGGTADVTVTASSVMAPGLQARYPSIQTYTIQGPSLSGRFSVTPRGVKGLYFDGDDPAVIEPMGGPAETDVATYAVFRASDLVVTEDLLGHLRDDVEGELDASHLGQARRAEHGGTLRTYRLAVATEGEVAERRVEPGAPPLSVAEVLAAVVESVNRANAIYERDLALTFQLVENNDQIIFESSDGDPFDTQGGELLGQTQDLIDEVIGDDNYDVGHLIRYGSNGGLARLQASCVSGAKASGWSDIRDESAAFDLLVFPHELGHMLGAPHSWVQFEDGGDFERNGFEPGPGFTIMSYPQFAGFRPAATRFGFFFHGGSIDFLNAHVRDGNGANCGTETETGNDVPDVTVPDGFAIPLGSRFTLDGSATDDSGTALSYTWEQMDRYQNGQGVVPFFRSLVPSESTSRTFPSLDRIFNGPDDLDEQTPDRPGTYNFQLTVRDNVAGGGAVGEGQVEVEIVDGGEPFEITSLGQFVVFEPGETADLQWNVAGSDGGDIGVDRVDVLLSVDNGETFEVIAQGVPNDGEHEITIPAETTDEGRIMVRPVGARFFAVNAVPFGIGNAPVAVVSTTALDFALDPGQTETQTVTVANTAAAATTLDYGAELRNVTLPGGGFVGDEDFLVSTSADEGGPAAGFEDITDGFKLSFQPTLAQAPAEDDGVARLTIPFQFPFYGRSYRTVYVSTNGLLILGNEQPHDATNEPIPSPSAPNGVIAPFWDDLTTDVGGAAVYADVLDDGRFAVQWDDVARFDEQDASFTFQVILDTDGSIEFQYGDLDGGRLDRATVGVENVDGTSGIELAFDEDFVTANTAVRLETPVRWLSLRDASGDVAGGGSDDFEVTVDATELAAGATLTADLVVRTSDASNAVVVIPVTLQLSGSVSVEDELEGATVSLAAPNPTSSRAVISVALATPGAVTATVHDALGRQVALVYDGDASGSLDLEVDAAGLAAGVYLVRVAGDGFVTTRQLVVAR